MGVGDGERDKDREEGGRQGEGRCGVRKRRFESKKERVTENETEKRRGRIKEKGERDR